MSGIEVIGVVIGLWPVVANVLTAYKAGKDFRSRQQLAGKLQLYRLQFRSFADKLLLGDEELTDEDRIRLTDPNNGDAASDWAERGLQSRMEERLGAETYQAIEFVASKMLELLTRLEGRLKRGEVDFVSLYFHSIPRISVR